jgi:ubiquinone/menaquinone biosynthesis C-methylase UbiE
VIGADLSPRMIDEARRRCAGRGRFLVADLAEPLPLEPRSLDGITSSLALHYVRDWSVPLRSLRRHCEQAGFVIDRIAEPQPSREALDRYPADLAGIAGVPVFIVYRLKLLAG